jgi:hypothetical protein
MGPSNLSQVFIVNNVTMLTGSTFNTSAATANASKFGIWNLDASTASINLANASTTALGTTVTVTSTAGLIVGMSIVKTAGAGVIPAATVSSITNATQFVLSAAPTTDLSGASLTATLAVSGGAYTTAPITDLKRVQFTQSTLGNIISSPIIDVNNIVRVVYNGFASDVQTHPIQTWNPASGTALPVPATKNIMVRIALRTTPTNYESFANPSNLNLDVVGTSGLPAAQKVFPLVGNFAAGRHIYNIEIPVASADTHVNACAFVKAAILASPTLSSIFSYNSTAAATLALTARHAGVEFDMVVQYSDGSGAPGLVTQTRLTPTTNYTQAISAEKAQRARYGNFNRMYFPVTQVDYAQPTYAYDMLEIQYKHDWPSSTGIARAGEINTLKVFVGSSSTALSAFADFATAFNLVAATDKDQPVDISLQQ